MLSGSLGRIMLKV